MEDFEDPSGQGLNPVVLIADATYLDSTNSLDIEHQKFCYYLPHAGHTVKLITLVNCQGKFESVFPLCSSQSPTCGDVYLWSHGNICQPRQLSKHNIGGKLRILRHPHGRCWICHAEVKTSSFCSKYPKFDWHLHCIKLCNSAHIWQTSHIPSSQECIWQNCQSAKRPSFGDIVREHHCFQSYI